MSDTVWIALISCVSTAIITIGSVVLAYFKLKEQTTIIKTHVNGLVTATQERADVATAAVVDIAKTAVDRQLGNGHDTAPPT